jgi:two-component system alkaline phosphatase synthesis response regulator PhoP
MQRILLIGTKDWFEVQASLTKAGYAVRLLSPDTRHLPEEFEEFAPSALLLELTDDLLMLQHVRRLLRGQLNAHPIPILALARRAHLDPPHLIVGVDDFLLPPYPADELLARVQMLLWRFQQVDTQHRVQVGGLVIDLARRSATADGQQLLLTLREFQLLEFLMTHRCRVFTRESLLMQIWGSHFAGDERVVDATIKRVRSKLPASYAALIETVRGLGYRFVPEYLDASSR